MSESLTVPAEGGTPTRRSRANRPEREVHRDAAPAVTIDTADTFSPEDAVADAGRQIQDRDRQVAESRRLAREAEDRARKAEAIAAQANTARVSDQQTAVAAAMEAAKSDQAAAKAAYRAAREAGDFDAEANANELLQAATFRFSSAAAQLDWMKNQPKPAAAQPQQDRPSAAAQRWIDEHPKFNTDDAYRATAEGFHNAALRNNKQVGSEEYVRYIDDQMTRVYGEGHGRDDGDGGRQPVRNAREAANGAAPPSRGGGGGQGGWKTIDTGLGKIQYQDRSDGSRGIRFTKRDQQADFEDGAQTCRMSLADYTNEQLNAALGGYEDIKVGDGRRYGGAGDDE